MKIGELRGLLKTAERDQLLGIIDIVYKALPKARKEDIDTDIAAVLSHDNDSNDIKKSRKAGQAQKDPSGYGRS